MSVAKEFDCARVFKYSTFTIACGGAWQVHGWNALVKSVAQLLYGSMVDPEDCRKAEIMLTSSKEWQWIGDQPYSLALDIGGGQGVATITRITQSGAIQTAWKKCSLCGAETESQASTSCVDELNPNSPSRCPGENRI